MHRENNNILVLTIQLIRQIFQRLELKRGKNLFKIENKIIYIHLHRNYRNKTKNILIM